MHAAETGPVIKVDYLVGVYFHLKPVGITAQKMNLNLNSLLFLWYRQRFLNLMWTIGQDSVFSMTVASTLTKSRLGVKTAERMV